MTRFKRYLLSIVLSVIPLAAVFLTNYWLYENAGIGVRRDIYDMIRSDESVMEEMSAQAAAPVAAAEAPPEPRWRGTPEKPLNMFFLGSSPTRRAILPEFAAGFEEEFSIRVHNMSPPMHPVDRYLDYMRMIGSKVRIDIVVIELHASMSNDFALMFNSRWGPATKNGWSGIVSDPALRRTQRSILRAAGDEAAADFALEPCDHDYRSYYDGTMKLLVEVMSNPRQPLVPPFNAGFRSHLDRWEDETGVPDVTAERSPWLLSNELLRRSVELLIEHCRAEGIGLLFHIPPRAPRIRANAGNECPMASLSAYFTINAIGRMADDYDLQVFDYDGWSGERSDFMDSFHLSGRGAEAYTKEIFSAIGEYIRSGPENRSYMRKGEAPETGAFERAFGAGPGAAVN